MRRASPRGRLTGRAISTCVGDLGGGRHHCIERNPRRKHRNSTGRQIGGCAASGAVLPRRRMVGQATDPGTRIVGREPELAALEAFLDPGGAPRAFVLSGEPGIGKTTVWGAGVDAGRRRGLRVLSARGSGAETRLSFAALIDLLDGVGGEELADLPRPQLHALEVALLRADATAGAPPEAHAIAIGFLNALRALAAREAVLVAIDDSQWLDAASGDALAFAARRLEAEPVAFLLARRPGPASGMERALERTTERLEMRSLSF